MKLDLPLPDGWIAQPASRADGRFVSYSQHGVGLLISSLMSLPQDPEAWLLRAALDELPAGAAATITARGSRETVDGWRALVVEAEVTGGAAARETRIVVLYQFLDHGAAAIVRGPAELVADRRDELLELLGKARPDFRSSHPVCLWEVFEGLAQKEGALPVLDGFQP